MPNLDFTLYDKDQKEFLDCGIKLKLNWVFAFVSANEISNNSIRIILDSDLIKGEHIERYLKRYDFFLKQTTLIDILNFEIPFFSFGRALAINKKYANDLLYPGKHKIKYNDILLNLPKWPKKRILNTIIANSS